jgi:hypothetical protein
VRTSWLILEGYLSQILFESRGFEVIQLVWSSEHDSPRFKGAAFLSLNSTGFNTGMVPQSYLSGKYVILPDHPQCLVLWDWASKLWTRIQVEGVSEYEVSLRTILSSPSHSSDFGCLDVQVGCMGPGAIHIPH